MKTSSSSVKTTGIFIAFSLFLLAGCTLNCKNSSQKGSFICKKEPFDSLIIHFNYGESAPDTIVEWALYKNGDLKRRISYGGEYAGDSCKIQVVKGEKQQTIQHLAHELFIDHSCPDIIKKEVIALFLIAANTVLTYIRLEKLFITITILVTT